MFDPTVSLLGVVARVLVVYAGLFVLLRLAGKKELGQLAPMDFLTILLLSETVSPALTAGDDSLPVAGAAAATLLGITLLLDESARRWPALGRLVEGRPSVLIRDGELDREVQKRQRLTDADVECALRREGVEAVSQVKRAVVEVTGKISVIRR